MSFGRGSRREERVPRGEVKISLRNIVRPSTDNLSDDRKTKSDKLLPRPEIAPIVILEADSTLDMLQIANLEEVRFEAQSSRDEKVLLYFSSIFLASPC